MSLDELQTAPEPIEIPDISPERAVRLLALYDKMRKQEDSDRFPLPEWFHHWLNKVRGDPLPKNDMTMAEYLKAAESLRYKHRVAYVDETISTK